MENLSRYSVGAVTFVSTLLIACGGAPTTPIHDPAASIVVVAPERVKVGETHAIEATVRDATGRVVERPVIWSVGDGLKATITPTGLLMPIDTGAIEIHARLDGVLGGASVHGYDWEEWAEPFVALLELEADNSVIDRDGIARRPELVLVCGGGTFWVLVRLDGMTTESGTVTHRLGNGVDQVATWLTPNDHSVLYPGITNAQHKNFAEALATVSILHLEFVESGGHHHALDFLVSGLSSRLPDLIAGCPSDI